MVKRVTTGKKREYICRVNRKSKNKMEKTNQDKLLKEGGSDHENAAVPPVFNRIPTAQAGRITQDMIFVYKDDLFKLYCSQYKQWQRTKSKRDAELFELAENYMRLLGFDMEQILIMAIKS